MFETPANKFVAAALAGDPRFELRKQVWVSAYKTWDLKATSDTTCTIVPLYPFSNHQFNHSLTSLIPDPAPSTTSK